MTWFRRMTLPLREFLRVDVSMTEQALRSAHPSARALMCAPSTFLLWLLDEMERAAADLRGLMMLRRPDSGPEAPNRD
jgi:hypothetical protein